LLAVILLPLSCGNSPENGTHSPKAAIIDQLYILQPNPSFISEATSMLESAGFEVDVWQGTDITVDFYRKLPLQGYKFIVFRVHSGILLELEGEKVTELENTYFFTAENYTSTKYVTDQLTDKVSYAIMEENYTNVFAVNSDFLRGAKGSFDRTVILAMGCESYRYDDLPKAFAEKGASAYIGWSGVVTLEYVDEVTLDLLNNLCTGSNTIAQSVTGTMNDIGHDPYFDSFLKYYPEDCGSRTVKELME
jgi:hypothetical protein